MEETSVCIIYQTDPLASIPGGIDTFIKGIIRWAPEDISISMIGISTSQKDRPVGKWSECYLGNRKFNFFPVLCQSNLGKQNRVPLTLRLTFSLLPNKLLQKFGVFNVLEFHRVEPCLAFLFDSTPKNLFVHQDMSVLNDQKSDIRWKYFPNLFYALENLLLPKFDSVYCVKESAVRAYRNRFIKHKSKFKFIPTWMDPDIFSRISENARLGLKIKLSSMYGFSQDDVVLISVGRLDHQKDPLLMLDAFAKVYAKKHKVRLVMVGDGVLKDQVKKHGDKLGLKERIHFVGSRSAQEIADLLRIADLFLLSSAYEGMPMCVLEALGCGLPVATTDVGEVSRVVSEGINGEITKIRSPESFSATIISCLDKIAQYRGSPCSNAVSEYIPAKVLEPVYENYRLLASK
ncbi:MAG: hypothetical protein AMJ61_09025 [Desulfobacterales bacterium SG8_35_2]|nr:MAG: hypothetical protein AMJ61_09025 [Desulfobacterales bacterium SG8_35_2]